MNVKQQLAEIEKQLQAKIREAMQKEVLETVQDEMVEAIEETVYNAYSSNAKKPYVRKERNGGLTDRNNIKGVMIGNDTLSVFNARTDEVSGDNIAQVVITGEGYTWENSDIYGKQPFPRDFISETENRLRANKNHIQALKKGLENRGVKIK